MDFTSGNEVLDVLYANPDQPLAVDTETTGFRVDDGRDICIGISVATVLDGKPYSAYYGLRHSVGENIDAQTEAKLRYVLSEQKRPLIFVNRQFDVLSMETVDIYTDDNPFYDLPTIGNMINENKPVSKSMVNLAAIYAPYVHKLVDDDFINAEKKTGWQNTTPERIAEYAINDAQVTYVIWLEMMKHREWTRLPEHVWVSKQNLIRVLTEMRRRGTLIDQELCREMADLGRSQMEILRDQLGINPGSQKQLQELLIDDLGLPVVKTSEKTGKPSFAKDVMPEYERLLEKLDSPVAQRILHYRGWQKAVTAAYEPYLERVSPDGRLRTEYTTHVTSTGRLSSREPNLQQIPKASDKPWNGRVKECFVAQPGYKLVNADYSQLELRLASAYADEEKLKQVFNEGRDIFTEMSQQLGMSRQDTKTLTYSIQYGAGIPRIMSAFDVSNTEAARLRQNFYDTYPKFRALSEAVAKNAEKNLETRIWTGRYRHYAYKSESYKAMNAMIQGGAADIVERMMSKLYAELDNEDCRMLMQVHDSVLFEVREDLVEEYKVKIKEMMEDVDSIATPDVGSFGVRFAVDIGEWTE